MSDTQHTKPQQYTHFDCDVSRDSNFVEGWRPDGRCHRCKSVKHLIDFSAYQRAVRALDQICKSQRMDDHYIAQEALKALGEWHDE